MTTAPATDIAPSNRTRYAWVILAACVALYGATLGVIGTTAGVFLTPVMEETGWSRTDASFYLTIMPLVAAVIQPIVGRLLNAMDVRVLLGATMVLLAGGFALTATFTAVWQWNLFGVLYGVALGVFMYLPIPTILGHWFAKGMGLALGIAMASSSVFGAIASPVAQQLIDGMGWRPARIVLAIVALIIGLPLTVTVLRLKPSLMGLSPYGYVAPPAGSAAKASATDGGQRPVRKALASAAFWMILVMAGAIVFSASMYQQLPSYAAGQPIGAGAGALAVSIVMVGGIIGKIAFGALIDRVGIRLVAIIALGSGAVGAFLLLSGGSNAVSFYAGAVLFGLGYASLSVIPPIITRQMFGAENFSSIYSGITTGLTLFSAAAPFAFAAIYDATGAFTLSWILVIGANIIALVLALLALSIGVKKSRAAATV